jgi:hypothetical protein
LRHVLRGSLPKNPSRVRVNHQPRQFKTGLSFVAVMARRFHGALPNRIGCQLLQASENFFSRGREQASLGRCFVRR